MADGGFTQAQLASAVPMAAGSAQVVPPGTLRIIGDNPTHDEAYIPLNPASQTSAGLLGYAANRMGYALAPMAAGGILGFADGGELTEQEFAASQKGTSWLQPQDPANYTPPSGGGGTGGQGGSGGMHGGPGGLGGLWEMIQRLLGHFEGGGQGNTGHTVNINMPLGTDQSAMRKAAKTMSDELRKLDRSYQ